MSIPTLVRRLPNFNSLATRMSTWLRRSPYNAPAVRMFDRHRRDAAGRETPERLRDDARRHVPHRGALAAGTALKRAAHLHVDPGQCVNRETAHLRLERIDLAAVVFARVIDDEIAGVVDDAARARAALQGQ